MRVFWMLLGLTFLEVVVANIGTGRTGAIKSMSVFGLVFLAFWKAGLVGMYFMHLKFEGKLLYLVCGVPIILTLVLTCGLSPDIANRVPLPQSYKDVQLKIRDQS